jgi:DNA replication and repair protein RecF
VHLEHLELRDYRCYRELAVDLGPGVRVFVGANAQGKTNLLEAVHLLATGSSHRVSSLGPLVRAGQDAAIVRAAAMTADTGRSLRVELELRPGGKNRARLGGQEHARLRDVIGVVRSVLFAPEDLLLVGGDPGDRRRFLDDLLSMRRPAYGAARGEYDKVLRQRNALLKDARRHGRAPDATLDDWTSVLVRTGATLLAARIAAVHALTGPVQEAYGDLAASAATLQRHQRIGLRYDLSTGRSVTGEVDGGVPDPVDLAQELAEGLDAVSRDERERGVTLAGPHRDELTLSVGELPAKGFASHGECWSLALALRLASREVLNEVGDEPVVLLDDVFAELDARRRERLANRCAQFEQVLVTAAVDADVPLAGPRYHVRAGTVTTAARSDVA